MQLDRREIAIHPGKPIAEHKTAKNAAKGSRAMAGVIEERVRVRRRFFCDSFNSLDNTFRCCLLIYERFYISSKAATMKLMSDNRCIVFDILQITPAMPDEQRVIVYDYIFYACHLKPDSIAEEQPVSCPERIQFSRLKLGMVERGPVPAPQIDRKKFPVTVAIDRAVISRYPVCSAVNLDCQFKEAMMNRYWPISSPGEIRTPP